jgi:DNA-binding transcriptional regulator LsrR (DeoR family)
MGIKENIVSEVVQKLKDGGQVPVTIISDFAKLVESGAVTRQSVTALVQEAVADGNKDKENTH